MGRDWQILLEKEYNLKGVKVGYRCVGGAEAHQLVEESLNEMLCRYYGEKGKTREGEESGY